MPDKTKAKVRTFHRLLVEGEDSKAKLTWCKGAKRTIATLEIDLEVGWERRKRRKREDCVQVLRVIVPSTWRFVERLDFERERIKRQDTSQREALLRYIQLWRYEKILEGLKIPLQVRGPLAAGEVRSFFPRLSKMSAATEESLRVISEALNRLSLAQSSSSWTRHLKTPDPFKPDNRDAELKQWPDWKFAFCSYVKSLDGKLAELMSDVEADLLTTYEFEDMTTETKLYANRLYGMLTSYLRNRPLKLIKSVKKENGFAAWRMLMQDLQPSTRQRSLALLTQLSRIQFQEGKTVTEQLAQYEALVDEYERISDKSYSDDAKVASILLACPQSIRSHLQLWIDDSTDYDKLKAKIMQLESMMTRWDSSNSLMMPGRASDDTSSPMEVDYIGKGYKGKKGQKGKGKEKGKSKGKDKGKKGGDHRGEWRNDWKGGDRKGKSSWEKGQAKSKGKGKDKGEKGKQTCHICNKPGHFARDCWRRVQQVEETSATASGSGGPSSTAPTITSQVKRIRLVTPPDLTTTELFDLTANDEETESIDIRYLRVINLEEQEGSDEFEECLEVDVWTPEGTPVIAMHWQDEEEDEEIEEEEEGDELHVRMVQTAEERRDDEVQITLDSGADVSVLPMSYGCVGQWRQGDREVRMVDAQGREIKHEGITRAKLRIRDEHGKQVDLVEDFMLGNVKHPILCAGKMLKLGWSITPGPYLQHSNGTRIPVRMMKHSLLFEAKVYAVKEEEGQKEEEHRGREEVRVCVLRGYPSKYVQDLEKAPGWHRLPNGVSAYSDPVATHFMDPSHSIEGDMKGRLTLIKDKDGMWRQLENAFDYKELGTSAFRKLVPTDEPQRTISFFTTGCFQNYWEQGSEVPRFPYPETKNVEREVEWSEDEDEKEEELEERWKRIEEDRMKLRELGEGQVEFAEVTYSQENSVKELKDACRERSLATSGSKKKLLERLALYKRQQEDRMQVEIADKLHREKERKPLALGQPRLPSVKEQELHFTTHLPYAPWCQACVANRGREDRHESVKKKEDDGQHIIEFDFSYTYTGVEDGRPGGGEQGRVQERQEQFGTCLVAVSTQTKSVMAVPVASKGSASLKLVTEELVRFSLENAHQDPVTFQADGERSTRQILRSIQQVRKALGLRTEIRTTGVGQHQSNGAAEQSVQSIRKMANTLRTFAGEQGRIEILGSLHLFPWSFKYASFLLNRFRVLEGINKTPYEITTGHVYRGKLVIFGETVLYKRMIQYKGSTSFEKGIWVGKNPWNDNHILIAEDGAHEARTIRRLAAEESFNGPHMVVAKGLPWAYSPQGILMKHAGHTGRDRQPTLEAEASEEDLKAIADSIARGMVTPMPLAAPMTPMTMEPRRPMQKRSQEDEESTEDQKRSRATRTKEDEEELTKKRKAEEDPEDEVERTREDRGEERRTEAKEAMPSSPSGIIRKAEDEGEGSPSKRLYAPYYAGIQAVIETHGDEESEGAGYIDPELENLIYAEEEQAVFGGEEDDEPPFKSEEELERLDAEAKKVEVERMLQMPAMRKATKEEIEEEKGYVISTKVVYTWKHRLEKGGWFRRGRLVARQFKSSVEMEQTFAPTSMTLVPRLMMFLMVNVMKTFQVMVLDVKDAFLMAMQPEQEKAYIDLDGELYKLIKCLPGQRTAASQWFNLFRSSSEEFGLEADVMQPTFMKKGKEMILTVHVDDVLLIGLPPVMEKYVKFLKEKKGWNIEAKGPFTIGEKFNYLKRQFDIREEGVVISCDTKHYEVLGDQMDSYSKRYRTTPLTPAFNKRDESPKLDPEESTKYRSAVGRMMYMASERPDAQYAIQTLAKSMSAPTKAAWGRAWHVASYLMGTCLWGILIAKSSKGQSVLDVREKDEVETENERHLLEVITDADYAGNKDDRKSTTSFQVFLDGSLIESKVRSQKSIALSSGESEFVAMVGGSSEGMLVKHLVKFAIGEETDARVRSDSSAARSMAQRQGIGRVRHLDASLLWIQQRERQKELQVSAVPSEINPADLGTKILTKARLYGLVFLLKMVDGCFKRIGREEFEEIQEKMQTKKNIAKIAKSVKSDYRVAAVIALAALTPAKASPIENDDMEKGSYAWMTFCALAFLGALSLSSLLRSTVVWICKKVQDMIVHERNENATNEDVRGRSGLSKTAEENYKHAVEVQTTKLREARENLQQQQSDMLRLEAELRESQEKVHSRDEEIKTWKGIYEGMTKQTNQLLDQVQHLRERELRMTHHGKVVHFDSRCRHFQHGTALAFCQICREDGGVFRNHETHVPVIT